MLRSICFIFSFFFFLFYSSVSLASSPFPILDDISSDATILDTLSLKFDSQTYDSRTFGFSYSKNAICQEGSTITDFFMFPLLDNDIAKIHLSHNPKYGDLKGLYVCIRVKKLSMLEVPYEYYLFSDKPLNISIPESDTTPPNLLSVQIENPLPSYTKGQIIKFIASFDDYILPYSSYILLGLNNGSNVMLNKTDGKNLRGDYVIGESTLEQIEVLEIKNINGVVSNIAKTETKNFSIPSISIENLKIKIIGVSQNLEIKFIDVVDSGSPAIDYVQIQVLGEILTNLSAKYSFSSDNICDHQDNFLDSLLLSQALIFNDTINNGKYFCVEITRTTNGEKQYIISENVFNIRRTVEASSPLPTQTLNNSVISPTGSGTIGLFENPLLIPNTNNQNSIFQSGVTLASENQTSAAPILIFDTNIIPNNINTGSQLIDVDNNNSISLPIVNLDYNNVGETEVLNRGISQNIFNDITDTFAKPYIEALAQEGIIDTKNESFYPDEAITRAEFLKLLLKSNDIDYSTVVPEANVFTDIVEYNWQSKVAFKSYQLGITNGYEDKTFRPESDITRIEAIKFMMKIKGYDLIDSLGSSFIDLPETWMKKYANKAKELGLINGQKVAFGSLFNPNTPITRAESAKIIAKSLEK